jgi:outer membrane protein TolC
VEEIGTIQGDTLFVALPKVTAAALKYNEQLAASKALTEAAQAEALGAWRGFLPQLEVDEFFLRTDDPLNNFAFKLNLRDVQGMSDFAPDRLNNPETSGLYTTRLQLRQPLFNGGMSFSGKGAADAAARAAGFDYQRTRETVSFQTVQAYQGLVLAKALEQVVRVAIESARANLRQAEALVEAEMATEADLFRAKVHLSGLEQRLIEALNLVALAGENIKLLTAVRTDLPLAPADRWRRPPPGVLPVNLDMTQLSLRSDLQAHRYRTQAAGKRVGVARGALLPHINLNAERNFFGQDPFGDEARSWSLGVYATWNLFSGLENIGKLKKARAEKRAAQYMYQFQKRRAKVEATEAWLIARAAHQKVAVAQEAVQAARESLRIVQNQYREGLVSMVDLLDTQAAATEAEGNLVQALHDYHIGLARLQFTGAVAQDPQE